MAKGTSTLEKIVPHLLGTSPSQTLHRTPKDTLRAGTGGVWQFDYKGKVLSGASDILAPKTKDENLVWASGLSTIVDALMGFLK